MKKILLWQNCLRLTSLELKNLQELIDFFYHVLGKFREIPKNLCQRVYQKIILSIFFIFLGKQIESTVLFVHYLPVEFFDDFIEAKIEFNFAFVIIASFSRRFWNNFSSISWTGEDNFSTRVVYRSCFWWWTVKKNSWN